MALAVAQAMPGRLRSLTLIEPSAFFLLREDGPQADILFEEAERLARIVRHGLPPTSMPGHEWLTDQQIADLVAYVKTLPKEIG